MDFSIYGIFGQTYGGNQAKFRKNGFRSLGRGSKMKHFPIKFWHLKFSFLLFFKITIFAICLVEIWGHFCTEMFP